MIHYYKSSSNFFIFIYSLKSLFIVNIHNSLTSTNKNGKNLKNTIKP